ncbi:MULTISPECIES: universal stress protein [Halorussus]|uniref:universal stress protein n=1 Tax=Halorussus TaxID=1070314 RepID=UPI000E210E07|nr:MULTISPECIES: universal stress protein [Halorussus]NHN61385.1 universal stress protein [Halorussus sp. JP-T4]
MYDSILVPVDGSEQSSRALDHAVGHAETYDAAVHLLFVVDVASLPAEVDAAPVAERLDTYGERIVAGAADRVGAADVDRIETAVVPGVPHQAILDYADDNDVDLVVMGTHGRTGLDRYLLGSVTERVVRRSPVPVLAVRTDEAAAASGE